MNEEANAKTLTTEEVTETATKEENNAPSVDDLTARIKALESELNKNKMALSKVNSEAADWKRQLREKQTEQERLEAERAETDKRREELLAEYQKRDRINTYKSKLMEAGVDAQTADLMANALPEGVNDEYFTTTKTFLEGQKQAFVTEALNKQPGLSVGMPPTSTDAKKAEDNKLRGYFGLPPLK